MKENTGAMCCLELLWLSFRGKTDKLGSTNIGNFMMLLEAISELQNIYNVLAIPGKVTRHICRLQRTKK